MDIKFEQQQLAWLYKFLDSVNVNGIPNNAMKLSLMAKIANALEPVAKKVKK